MSIKHISDQNLLVPFILPTALDANTVEQFYTTTPDSLAHHKSLAQCLSQQHADPHHTFNYPLFETMSSTDQMHLFQHIIETSTDSIIENPLEKWKEILTLTGAQKYISHNHEIWWDPSETDVQSLRENFYGSINCIDGRWTKRPLIDDTMTKKQRMELLGVSIPWWQPGFELLLDAATNDLMGNKVLEIKDKLASIKHFLITKYGKKNADGTPQIKLHTDTHHPDTCKGCGYLNNCMCRPATSDTRNEYGLYDIDITTAQKSIHRYGNMDILQWEHLEKAVFTLPKSEHNKKLFGIRHQSAQDVDNSTQAFVVNQNMTQYAATKVIKDYVALLQVMGIDQHIQAQSPLAMDIYKKNDFIFSKEDFYKNKDEYLTVLMKHQFQHRFNHNTNLIAGKLAANLPSYAVYLDHDDVPLVIPAWCHPQKLLLSWDSEPLMRFRIHS